MKDGFAPISHRNRLSRFLKADVARSDVTSPVRRQQTLPASQICCESMNNITNPLVATNRAGLATCRNAAAKAGKDRCAITSPWRSKDNRRYLRR